MSFPRADRTASTMGGVARLASRTWQEAGGIMVVPLGSTEQHGPHLPLDVDARIATAVADDLVARWRATGRDACAAPVVSFGASGEHAGFAGTVSIGTEVLRAMIIEIGRSASEWTERLVFVNGHGGNVDAVSSAVRVLGDEGRDAQWLPCEVGGADPHAGRAETSGRLLGRGHGPGKDARGHMFGAGAPGTRSLGRGVEKTHQGHARRRAALVIEPVGARV